MKTILLLSIAMLFSCAGPRPLRPDQIPSYSEAERRTIKENDAYLRGEKYGYGRAIIELKNESGEAWERYLEL